MYNTNMPTLEMFALSFYFLVALCLQWQRSIAIAAVPMVKTGLTNTSCDIYIDIDIDTDIHASQWVEGSDALPFDDKSGLTLTDEQIKDWVETGFTIVNNVFEAELIQDVVFDLQSLFESRNTQENLGDSFSDDSFTRDKLIFPSAYNSINNITLHSRLLNAVLQLLNISVSNGTKNIRLLQSETWGKYGIDDGMNGKNFDIYSNQEQRVHLDYRNYHLLVPQSVNVDNFYNPNHVSIIVYYTNNNQTGGSTKFVPRKKPKYSYDKAYDNEYIINEPGFGNIDWTNDLYQTETKLYNEYRNIYYFRQENLYSKSRLKYVDFVKGTVLFYRSDVWHGGSNPIAGKIRFSTNLVFSKKSELEYFPIYYGTWALKILRKQYGYPLENVISQSTVEQRNVLGFPEPGHDYWNQDTINGVNRRYGPFGFDPTPYYCKLNNPPQNYITRCKP